MDFVKPALSAIGQAFSLAVGFTATKLPQKLPQTRFFALRPIEFGPQLATPASIGGNYRGRQYSFFIDRSEQTGG